MAKSAKQFYFSPKGIVMPYCWIQKADTKYKPQGEFKIDLKVPNDEAQGLVDAISNAHDANWEENKDNPKLKAKGKKPQEADLPFYEEDGYTIFKFRMNASYIKDEEVIPLNLRVVDSKGVRMQVVPNVSGGSEGKCRFSFYPFAAVGQIGVGIKLQLDSFMLTKLVEYSGATGVDSEWAKEADEDGYQYDPSTAKAPKEDQQEGGWNGGSDDEGGNDPSPTPDF